MSSTKSLARRALLGLALSAPILLAPAPARAAGQNKIVYDTFDWSIYSSTHFDVHYYLREKDTLQKIVSMAESAYDELSRRLNYQINKKIPIIYFATHAEFEQNNVDLNFIPEGVGAFAEPARNRMVLPIDVPDEKLQGLIQHELTHVFEYELLFGGRLARVLTASPPLWFMEGLASYFGNDEDDKDRMYLRDAVNSDLIPPITKVQIGGYAAYRYGHAVFDFIEAEWGKDAVREFVYEFRSFGGRDIAIPIRRSFEIQPDDFDLKFRRFLRKKFLPLLAVKGEASEYGEKFRIGPYDRPSFEVGAAPSPSGDFIATMTTYKDDIDIALLSVKDRKVFKNLSPGRTTKYEYLVSQYLTSGPASGRDLSFAPDGDRIAVFGRFERGRKLMIFSARGGGLLERISVEPDIPLSPSWSPDGNSIVFAGTENNIRDIFVLDMKTKLVRNLSSDPGYDEAPVFSSDGKWIYHQKIIGGLQKIVRFPLAEPTKVEQVTWGEGNDEDPAFSPDGKRLYFSSSRGGIYNIYSQDIATGETWQYTDVIGAAIGPAAFIGPDGQEKVVFSGFQGLRFQLYMADSKKPFKKLEDKAPQPATLKPGAVTPYIPSVEVSIDPEKVKRPKFKLFLENAQALAGYNSDSTFVSQVRLDFSDLLGNHRGIFIFDSVSTFTNFQIAYFDISKRLQLGIVAYDDRAYYVTQDINTGQITRDQRAYRNTALQIQGIYPISRYTRLEGNIGFLSRSLDVPYYITNATGSQFATFDARSDNDPTAGVGFSYDSTRWQEFGPNGGRRVDVSFQYTPDLKNKGTLTSDVYVDARQYLPLSRRVLFAFRAVAAHAAGNAPNVYPFGGLDTMRGYDYNTLIGNNVFYVNCEFRFPLVDLFAAPYLVLQGIRGRIFLDIGGAWLKNQPFQFWDGTNGQLGNAVSAYGAGFTVYFLGLPWNVDFARPWNFRQAVPLPGEATAGLKTTFYIGTTF